MHTPHADKGTQLPGSGVIRGAILIDGDELGTEFVDVSFADGVITDIGPAGHATDDVIGEIIDADGMIVMPGFIDAHTHAEAAIFDPAVQQAMLAQGITTVVTGQDGVSYAPSHDPAAPVHDATAWATGYFAAINGEHPTFTRGGVAELRATWIDLPMTVEYLVPHGTLRYAVMGDAARTATAEELDRLVALLRQGLDEGAVGMSTGLEYLPGGYADEAELVALTRVLAERGLPHVSHMRGYETLAPQAFAELRAIATTSGVATHISHYHGPGDELAGMVDDARAAGLDVTFDSYPYLKGCSILSMVTLPTTLPLADPDRCAEMLSVPALAQELIDDHLAGMDDLWPRVTLAAVPGEDQWAEGKTLLDVAEYWGVTPAEATVRLLISTRLRASCVFAQPPTNSSASVRTLLRHEAHMAGSDAIYLGGRPHPRGWGTFARFIAQHVRDLGDWTWGEAQRHLSTAAAERFGLHDRGVVAVGYRADLVVLDPSAVTDVATYAKPRQPGIGVEKVISKGRRVFDAQEVN